MKDWLKFLHIWIDDNPRDVIKDSVARTWKLFILVLEQIFPILIV